LHYAGTVADAETAQITLPAIQSLVLPASSNTVHLQGTNGFYNMALSLPEHCLDDYQVFGQIMVRVNTNKDNTRKGATALCLEQSNCHWLNCSYKCGLMSSICLTSIACYDWIWIWLKSDCTEDGEIWPSTWKLY